MLFQWEKEIKRSCDHTKHIGIGTNIFDGQGHLGMRHKDSQAGVRVGQQRWKWRFKHRIHFGQSIHRWRKELTRFYHGFFVRATIALMTPANAHRLLTAPTAVWIAHQHENPSWGQDIAQCLRAQTISPLAVTNNLRKLTDCLAHPDIEPLLSEWMHRHFVSHTRGHNATKEDRLQEGISRCVRSMQLQSLAQGHHVNILPKLDTLFALSGTPADADHLVYHWKLTDADVYTIAHRKGEYFSNGRSLGNKTNLKKALSAYHQQFAQACVATPALVKAGTAVMHMGSTYEILGKEQPLAHAMLWEQARLLDFPTKLALAYDWANNASPWSTRAQDEQLSPQKTKHWHAWALHAQTYLAVSGEKFENLHKIVQILQDCPPLPVPIESIENFDTSVFTDTSIVVQ